MFNFYLIRARNYYSQYGEIDIIAEKGKRLVFFEVKTRTNLTFGHPEESVNKKKIESILMTVEKYFEDENIDEIGWQIDLLAVQINKSEKVEIIHFEDISQ